MKKVIILFLAVLMLNCQVIGRNQKVKDLIALLEENGDFYRNTINEMSDKIQTTYNACIQDIKEANCSDSQIWQQQRAKISQNITNLRDKIMKQNKTIDSVLQLNKKEVIKKNLTMQAIFPQIEKLKNDVELIEDILFLVEDTFLNLENPVTSMLLLFDHQLSNSQAPKMQKMFMELTHQQDGTTAQQADTSQKPATGEMPLVDEDIFNGQIDQKEVQVDNLFVATEEDKKQGKSLYADELPNGVNVKQHDQTDNEFPMLALSVESFDDLRIYEVKEQFKNDIKDLGKIIHDRFSTVKGNLLAELSMRTQAVADLEKAIIDLHHKHAKEIIQIYVETKKLQLQIFELDDQVMSLDAQIYDCMNSDKRLEECENRKGMDEVIINDLKTERSFNQATLNELEKLLEFEDRNINAPAPRLNAENINNQGEMERTQAESTEIDKRITQIKDEQEVIGRQLQDNEIKQAKIGQLDQQLQKTLPEHLIDAPEIKNIKYSNVMRGKNDLQLENDENAVMQQVDNELKNTSNEKGYHII